jgi:hypothetical protein
MPLSENHMAINYLERLLAEWYEYQGYFLRRNVKVGKRKKGGWTCELDIVAFHPGKKHLIQLEPSTDGDAWDKREKRYGCKFEAGRRYIPELFRGFNIPDTIEQVAVLVFAGRRGRKELAGGRLVHAQDLFAEIVRGLRQTSIYMTAVPEQYPILRTIQFVCEYRNHLLSALG